MQNGAMAARHPFGAIDRPGCEEDAGHRIGCDRQVGAIWGCGRQRFQQPNLFVCCGYLLCQCVMRLIGYHERGRCGVVQELELSRSLGWIKRDIGFVGLERG